MKGPLLARGQPGAAPSRPRVALAVVAGLVLAACGSGTATTSVVPSAPPPSGPIETAVVPTTTPAPTTAPTLGATQVAHDVAYQTSDAMLKQGILDVYAPSGAGPWPVVVMFHGTPSAVTKDFLAEYGQRLAGAGRVVFVASWGHVPMFTNPDPYAYAAADNAQVACAIAYAAAHAAEFNGDPAMLIVFGHSGGSNVGSIAAFGGVVPGPGCASRGDPGPVDALVTWDGNWLLDPGFDDALKADPRTFDLMTPWSLLQKRPDLPVVMLMSEAPGRDVEVPFSADQVATYLALRDHDGVLARLVAKLRPFDDGVLSMSDMQPMLLERLHEIGNPATLTVAPGSTHTYFAKESWPVFFDAFDRAVDAART